ncbi:MAG: hypothetical protein E2601_13060 [Microbacterium sp.]|uniref:hypothetical protein n=1 Tax=Microbacterium sp. ER1 TaxID=1932846 RepID=UPI0012C34B4A|nr:hypothetical protein [Microbacterium sp. ER1]MPT15821.1 hypothetical protein [Microbacterium sp.]
MLHLLGAAAGAILIVVGVRFGTSPDFQYMCGPGTYGGPCSGATILALACLIAGAVLYGQFGTRRWLWVPGAGAAGAVILAEYQGVPVNPFSFAVVLILAAAAVATSVIGIIKGHVARSAK